MLKTFKYRLLPNKKQSELIDRHIGCSRFVYNLALECKHTAYASNKTNLSYFDLTKQLPDLKKECRWLKEVNSQSLQQSIVLLDSAFVAFFKGINKYPKFKKKGKSNSFVVPQHIKIQNNKLFIPKFKSGIKINLHRNFSGKIKQAIISETKTGKFFASIICEISTTKKQLPIKVSEKTTIGIDLGIKSFLVTSDGQKFDNPKFLRKAQSKLKFIQCKYSKHKGKQTKHRLAILHEKVANQRKDFLHKTSTKLIRENQSVAIEDLQIKNMVKNHCVAQSISDAGWGMFIAMLKYKAEWYNKNILQIGKFDPSSKTCSCCGKINGKLTLNDRAWECPHCLSKLDRDFNAAINIKNFALIGHLSADYRHKNRNELPTLVGVMTSEAITPFKD